MNYCVLCICCINDNILENMQGQYPLVMNTNPQFLNFDMIIGCCEIVVIGYSFEIQE